MMPEYGHALLCWRSAWRCCCPFTRCGAWRAARRADDGVGRGVRGCCSSAWRARFSITVVLRAFVVNDFTVACRRQLRTRSCRCGYRWPPRGGGARAAAVGAADERRWTWRWRCSAGEVPAKVIVARCWRWNGMVCAGFLAFILFCLGPFARTLPTLSGGGRDLNPLLRDPGLIFHP